MEQIKDILGEPYFERIPQGMLKGYDGIAYKATIILDEDIRGMIEYITKVSQVSHPMLGILSAVKSCYDILMAQAARNSN